MDSTEQRLDFNQDEEQEGPDLDEFEVPPSVLQPDRANHYRGMLKYLRESSDEIVDFLVNTHGSASPSRRMAEVWGIWLTLQEHIIQYEATEKGWDDGDVERLKPVILEGLMRLGENFEDRQGMAEFLEEAKGLLVKEWQKNQTEYIKSIIVKKR